MIKIKSCFPKTQKNQEIGIQTQEILPTIYNFKHKMTHSKYQTAWLFNNNHDSSNQNSKVYKIQQPKRYKKTILHQNRQFLFKNSSIMNVEILNHNRRQNQQTGKIDAKQFKFLPFEENALKSAVVQYLSKNKLSKKQQKKLHQKIVISQNMLQKNNITFRLTIEQQTQNQDICKQNQNEIKLSIKQLIDSIIENIQLFVKTKLHRQFQLKDYIKKIWLIIQNVVQFLKKQVRKDKSYHNKTLNSFIGEFIQNIDKERTLSDKMDSFYQQMFAKYEKKPFNARPTKCYAAQIEIPKKQIKEAKPSIRMRKFQFINRLNNYKSMQNDSSMAKTNLHNNLKQQVKCLQQDTDKIMRDYGENL